MYVWPGRNESTRAARPHAQLSYSASILKNRRLPWRIMHLAEVSRLFAAFRRPSLHRLLLAAGAGASVIAAMPASAVGQGREEGTATTPTKPIAFDIAAQPLQSALDAYGAATGLEVLYDSRLAAGRRSGGVAGALTPATALQTLLQGTGLRALYAGANAFAVVPAPPVAVPPLNAAGNAAAYRQYFGVIQANIADAFCRQAETVPGAYRLALRFWIGPTGAILRPELLGSTDNAERDAAIAEALRQVTLSPPPPIGMPQPITMVVAPRRPEQTGDCSP